MKKIIFLSICLLITAATVNAQRRYPHRGRRPYYRTSQRNSPPPDKVKFGVVGGVNISNIVNINDPNFTTDTKAGANVGISLDVPIHYPLSFETELLYSEKGYRAITPYGTFTQRNNFIDLPLLAKITLTPGFNLLVGPQVSFLLSTQNVYTDGFTTTVQNQYNTDSNGYNKTIVGGVLGVSFDLSPNIELRGRYITDLQNTNINGVSNIPQYRNQVWQIGLGLKF